MARRRPLLGLLITCVALAAGAASAGAAVSAAAPAQAAERVDAGALRATVADGSFGVAFTDAEGDEVLTTAPGRLELRRAGVWSPLTRVLATRREGDAVVVDLQAPGGGAPVPVRVAPAGDGVVRLSARLPAGTEAGRIAFDGTRGERFLGFGERSDAVSRTGGDVFNRVTEGPYQPEENPFLTAFVPPPGQNSRRDATYYPVPWLLSTAGHGVLLDGHATSTFRLGAPWSAEVEGEELSLRVFAGPTPAQALRRFTASVGRQPPAAAPFFFGPWWQPQGGSNAVNDDRNLATLSRAGALGSVAQTYTHYLPCGDQQGVEQRERDRVRRFHDAGLAITTYFNPMVCSNYDRVFQEAQRRDVLHKDALGNTLLYRYTGSTQFFVSQFDFTAPGANEYYGDLLDEAVSDGHDGWMEDFGEYTPDEARSHDGTPGRVMHNRYVDLYHEAGAQYARTRAGKPLARFNRSGWTGTAQHAALVWGGDPSTSWGFDGLESSVRNGLSMGLSGVSLWGSDIGGFFALSQPQTTPELLRRWIQFGFASGVMRTQANGFALRPQNRAQIFDDDVLPVWTRYAQLRTQLQPYLAAAQREYDRTGLPMMRHLALAYPDDRRAQASELEYLLGGDLLVAPVVAPGSDERTLRLPEGRWVDLWRSATLDADRRHAPRLGRPRVLEGEREVTLPAPADELPLLVREGALLALLPSDVDTLAEYGAGRRVRLADREQRRTLLGWPAVGKRGTAEPADDARARSVLKRNGTWVMRLTQERRRRYDLQIALPAKPCRVTVNGRRLGRRDWRYADGILRTSVRLGRSGRVAAPRRCR